MNALVWNCPEGLVYRYISSGEARALHVHTVTGYVGHDRWHRAVAAVTPSRMHETRYELQMSKCRWWGLYVISVRSLSPSSLLDQPREKTAPYLYKVPLLSISTPARFISKQGKVIFHDQYNFMAKYFSHRALYFVINLFTYFLLFVLVSTYLQRQNVLFANEFN